jgi:nitrogen fixation NifU-like protein
MSNTESAIPAEILHYSEDDTLYGRMNDPTSCAFVQGRCGDSMEFHLYIQNQVIEDIRYVTDGCEYSRACGMVVASAAKGLPLEEALGISPKLVLDTLAPHLPPENRHCAILAVGTLYQAIADYLLKP